MADQNGIYKAAIEIFELKQPNTREEELAAINMLTYIDDCVLKAITPEQKEFVSALIQMASSKENFDEAYDNNVKATEFLVKAKNNFNNRMNLAKALADICLEKK